MTKDFEHARAHLAARIARWTGDGEQYMAPIAGLSLHRHTQAGAPVNCMLEPAIAMPVQGAKRTRLGADVYAYGQRRFLITSLNLPVAMQVAKASPDAPYLSAVLRLDTRVIGDLVMESGLPPGRRRSGSTPGMVLGDTTAGLLAAFDRLVGLLDEPELIPVLAPLAQREVFYRVLQSDAGGALWQMASIDHQNHHIGRAIDWLKAHFREPLGIAELAARVGMSPSRFHHHFRRLTSMSPLQFQKWLRLTEARRLMLLQGVDASTAAYGVGYESPSQFSREYSRQFGTSPRRDVEGLQQAKA
ncbi:AraC family transcriptional regulator [Acidovorax sp. NCPPB 2350]|nr:AraC family transcriptional regulator [Acidovorax sp. NCPPB 2350]